MELKIGLVKFLVIVSVNSCIGFRTQNIVPSVMSTLVLLTIPEYPEVSSLPILPSFLNFRKSKAETTTTTTTPKPVRKGYLRVATDLLKWAYKELQETEEDDDDSFGISGSGRYDAEKFQDSSEEDSKVPKLDTLEEKVSHLRKSRRGTAARTDSEVIKPSHKQTPLVYDKEIEEASLPELKSMLMNLRREETGFMPHPSTDITYSFGTRLVRSIFCGYLNPLKIFC